MKDYVFIGWSRNKEIATCLKAILDKEGFICVIGGEHEGNPPDVGTKKTVHETVINQMNHCDQAILLFRKKDDNSGISGNLIYELGYLSALYNSTDSYAKVHIYKIDITEQENSLFPSDLHGIWGTNISTSNISTDKKSDEEIAREIADIFINKQYQIARKDKFEILNDHHFIEYEMTNHFETPSMSDYDLAEEILVYVLSAFCYHEQKDIRQKMAEFKKKMIEKKKRSKELNWSVDYALVTLELFCRTIPDKDGCLSMDKYSFTNLYKKYKSIGNAIIGNFKGSLKGDDIENVEFDKEFALKNHFEALLIGQLQEHFTYLILVYCFSKIEQEEKNNNSRIGINYCNKAIANLEILKENPEDEMYVKILLSYAYKNLATFNEFLDNDNIENKKNKDKSLELREEMNAYVENNPTIRLSLKDYIGLEYFLQVVDHIEKYEDEHDRTYYLKGIKKFIDEREELEAGRNYMVNDLKNKYNRAARRNERIYRKQSSHSSFFERLYRFGIFSSSRRSY